MTALMFAAEVADDNNLPYASQFQVLSNAVMNVDIVVIPLFV